MPTSTVRWTAMAALVTAAAFVARAQEFQPYPTPQITPEQWMSYADLVREAHAASVQFVREEKVLVFSDLRTRTFWVFTTRDHPAHPAWITRRMVEENGQVNVQQIGYFAGSEPEFAKLFRSYQERNAQLMEDVQRRNQ